MESRGRQSESEREVSSVVRIADVRPEPPAELGPDEAIEWRRVVNSMPLGWYRNEYHGVLIPYCEQIVVGRQCAAQARELTDKFGADLDLYIKLTKMAERANRAVDKFGTTLRVTPQSRYDREKAARDSNKGQNQRPW